MQLNLNHAAESSQSNRQIESSLADSISPNYAHWQQKFKLLRSLNECSFGQMNLYLGCLQLPRVVIPGSYNHELTC